LVAAGGVLAACAPKATPAPAQPAPGQPAAPTTVPAAKARIPIKYHIFWNQPQVWEQPFRATAEWKAMEEAGLEIEFGTGRGGDAGRTAVAAGTPPDVGDLGPQYDFALGGKLLDLGPYVDASTVIKPEMFFEDNWKDGQFAGWLHGIPAHECYCRRGLNMNKKLIGEAGLDINNPPLTWDELFEWHRKLTKFDAAGNLLQFGIDPYDAEANSCAGGDGWFWEELYNVKGFDNDTGTWQLNRPEFVEAFDMFGEFVRYVKPDNLQGVRSVEGQGTWGGSYNAEVQAMIIEGYWHPGETAKEKPEVSVLNVAAWVPMPVRRKGVKIQTFCGHVTSLFKDGAHAKEAFPIIEFLQSTAACDIIFNTIGWLPALKDYVAKADGSKYPGLQFYLDSATEHDESHPARRTPISSFVSTKYNQYKEQVYRDTMTAKQAADAWQKDAEGEWKESGWKDKWGKG
jgi:maltose-binding protein MalE